MSGHGLPQHGRREGVAAAARDVSGAREGQPTVGSPADGEQGAKPRGRTRKCTWRSSCLSLVMGRSGPMWALCLVDMPRAPTQAQDWERCRPWETGPGGRPGWVILAPVGGGCQPWGLGRWQQAVAISSPALSSGCSLSRLCLGAWQVCSVGSAGGASARFCQRTCLDAGSCLPCCLIYDPLGGDEGPPGQAPARLVPSRVLPVVPFSRGCQGARAQQ